MRYQMKTLRCPNCAKKLCNYEGGFIEIKCPRCKHIYQNAKSVNSGKYHNDRTKTDTYQ
ncbi:Com family DNA-binding transcriptional regulator [Photobacterium damselae]|uniref:Com family DNA-binding transcriptional regulator n=1 Tax=Photobacterium damselae TaxID=38293 RepID=UPI00387EBF2F